MAMKKIEVELSESTIMFIDDRAYVDGISRSVALSILLDLGIMSLPPEERPKHPPREKPLESRDTPMTEAEEEAEYQEIEKLFETVRKEKEERKGKLSQ